MESKDLFFSLQRIKNGRGRSRLAICIVYGFVGTTLGLPCFYGFRDVAMQHLYGYFWISAYAGIINVASKDAGDTFCAGMTKRSGNDKNNMEIKKFWVTLFNNK